MAYVTDGITWWYLSPVGHVSFFYCKPWVQDPKKQINNLNINVFYGFHGRLSGIIVSITVASVVLGPWRVLVPKASPNPMIWRSLSLTTGALVQAALCLGNSALTTTMLRHLLPAQSLLTWPGTCLMGWLFWVVNQLTDELNCWPTNVQSRNNTSTHFKSEVCDYCINLCRTVGIPIQHE